MAACPWWALAWLLTTSSHMYENPEFPEGVPSYTLNVFLCCTDSDFVTSQLCWQMRSVSDTIFVGDTAFGCYQSLCAPNMCAGSAWQGSACYTPDW